MTTEQAKESLKRTLQGYDFIRSIGVSQDDRGHECLVVRVEPGSDTNAARVVPESIGNVPVVREPERRYVVKYRMASGG